MAVMTYESDRRNNNNQQTAREDGPLQANACILNVNSDVRERMCLFVTYKNTSQADECMFAAPVIMRTQSSQREGPTTMGSAVQFARATFCN